MSTDRALHAAFLETSYGPADERFRLTDERGPSPSWSRPGARWALLTAWNPGAERRIARENEAAQARLRARLSTPLGSHALLEPAPTEMINGEAAPGADWREPALLAWGLGLRETAALCREFGQLAAVWGCGQRAALVWCGGPAPAVTRRWASIRGPL